jgi:diguanylate cyclase (GGDEF)-like protein
LSKDLKLDEAKRIIEGDGLVTDDLQEIIDRLCALSMHDGLTGVFNRRYFDDRVKEEVRRAQRSNQPLCVILGDIDHFKVVNDRYGHQVGDSVLRMVAKTFSDSVRSSDSVSRYGGEEFVALLPNTTAQGALNVAWRIREAVDQSDIRLESKRLAVAISLGVAAFAPADTDDAAALVKRADRQLYRAKNEGRNRVCCAPEDLERMKSTGVTSEERSLLFT